MVVAHAVSFIIFFLLTIHIFETDLDALHFLWIIAWVAAGAATGVFWMLAASSARNWISFVRQNLSLAYASIIIVLASWGFGFLSNRSWKPLRTPTLLTVKWILEFLGQDVVYNPAEYLIGTETFSVSIYPACAGYEGIGLILVFVGTYLWLFRGRLRFPQAIVLLPCASLLIWFLNAVRIASLVLVGAYISPEIALGGFHSETGWLNFIAVALALVAVTHRMPFFTTQSNLEANIDAKVEGDTKGGNPTTAYLGPLMALLAVTMVTGIFSSDFDWLYPARVLATAAAIWLLWRKSITRVNLAGTWDWGPVCMGLEWAMGVSSTGSSIAKKLQDMPAGLAASWLIFRVLGSVVTVPIAEELAFRGYLLRRLISADFEKLSSLRFTWLSFLSSSILFGALHGRWLAGSVAGMFYAWALYRRGKVGDAIIAHAITNVLIAATVFIFGKWNLWN